MKIQTPQSVSTPQNTETILDMPRACVIICFFEICGCSSMVMKQDKKQCKTHLRFYFSIEGYTLISNQSKTECPSHNLWSAMP